MVDGCLLFLTLGAYVSQKLWKTPHIRTSPEAQWQCWVGSCFRICQLSNDKDTTSEFCAVPRHELDLSVEHYSTASGIQVQPHFNTQ